MFKILVTTSLLFLAAVSLPVSTTNSHPPLYLSGDMAPDSSITNVDTDDDSDIPDHWFLKSGFTPWHQHPTPWVSLVLHRRLHAQTLSLHPIRAPPESLI
ncbi:hypothetical protein QKW35_00160 [Pontibacterium granulatum]|uniref:hypothetical protein n=1 Tax=Pontibacterium granulatum TaxID=2036029 RepID=UPI00249B9968|nr:hypothetical protein [Pontibacterium granulatum]MDI3322776.1 hypothetical protein [Pontibacterium granulatum]